MSAPIVLQMAYSGTLIPSLITTSPWKSVTSIFPERGSMPIKPQFDLEVLQPRYLDAARYRVGGLHFPQFTLLTITPAVHFHYAKIIAREMEMCKGDEITLTIPNSTADDAEVRCVVLDVKANATGKRVLGAAASLFANGGEVVGPASSTDAMASVDTTWTLQVMAQ